jgi:hypothetical protein
MIRPGNQLMSRFTQNLSRALAIFTLAAVLVLIHQSAASACPNCKEGVGSQANLARGFYYSILFMLGTPITIVTVFGVAFYRSVKKAQAEQAANSESQLEASQDKLPNDDAASV